MKLCIIWETIDHPAGNLINLQLNLINQCLMGFFYIAPPKIKSDIWQSSHKRKEKTASSGVYKYTFVRTVHILTPYKYSNYFIMKK
jgi:hypothetical protein